MSIFTISNTTQEDYNQEVRHLAELAAERIEQGQRRPEVIHELVDSSKLVIYTAAADAVCHYSNANAADELWKTADSFQGAKILHAFELLMADVSAELDKLQESQAANV